MKANRRQMLKGLSLLSSDSFIYRIKNENKSDSEK